MSTNDSPLFSMDARGSLDQSLSFSRSRHQNKVSKYPKAQQTTSYNQFLQRQIYLLGILRWQTLTPAQKAAYRETGNKKHRTAYQEHISEYLKTKPDIVAFWPLAWGDSPQNPDYGPGGHDLTNHNTLSLPGIAGSATYYNGVNAWSNYPNPLPIENIDCYMATMWVYPTGYGRDDRGLFLKIDPSLFIYYSGANNGSVRWGGDDIAGAWAATSPPGSFPLNEGYFLSYVFNGGMHMLFRDQEFVDVHGRAPLLNNPFQSIRLGGMSNASQNFEGILDNLVITGDTEYTIEMGQRLHNFIHYP